MAYGLGWRSVWCGADRSATAPAARTRGVMRNFPADKRLRIWYNSRDTVMIPLERHGLLPSCRLQPRTPPRAPCPARPVRPLRDGRAGTAARPHLNQKERGVMTKTKVLGYLALVLLCTAVVLLLIALRGS